MKAISFVLLFTFAASAQAVGFRTLTCINYNINCPADYEGRMDIYNDAINYCNDVLYDLRSTPSEIQVANELLDNANRFLMEMNPYQPNP